MSKTHPVRHYSWLTLCFVSPGCGLLAGQGRAFVRCGTCPQVWYLLIIEWFIEYVDGRGVDLVTRDVEIFRGFFARGFS